MVNEIYELKNMILEQAMKDAQEKGVERLDGETIDMIKDLAEAEKACWEAEYYRGVSEAMDSSGYDGMTGYNGGRSSGGTSGGRSGYPMGYRQSGRGSANQYGGRRGYNMGYDIEGLKMAMQSADPQERERIKREMQQMMTSM